MLQHSCSQRSAANESDAVSNADAASLFHVHHCPFIELLTFIKPKKDFVGFPGGSAGNCHERCLLQSLGEGDQQSSLVLNKAGRKCDIVSTMMDLGPLLS